MAKREDLKIEDHDVKIVIENLIACGGVGMPMASSILKFLRPDVFPIIDVRAYRALFGQKIYYSGYTYEKYMAYARKIYDIRDKTGIPLREIDEKLYSFDKLHNLKI